MYDKTVSGVFNCSPYWSNGGKFRQPYRQLYSQTVNKIKTAEIYTNFNLKIINLTWKCKYKWEDNIKMYLNIYTHEVNKCTP